MNPNNEDDITDDFLRREREALQYECPEVLERLQAGISPIKEIRAQAFDTLENSEKDHNMDINYISAQSALKMPFNTEILQESTNFESKETTYRDLNVPEMNVPLSEEKGNNVVISADDEKISSPVKGMEEDNSSQLYQDSSDFSNLFIGSPNLENMKIYKNSIHTRRWYDEVRQTIAKEEAENQAEKQRCIEESKKRLAQILEEYNDDTRKSAPVNFEKSEKARSALLDIPSKENIWVWVKERLQNISTPESPPASSNSPRIQSPSFTNSSTPNKLLEQPESSMKMERLLDCLCEKNAQLCSTTSTQ